MDKDDHGHITQCFFCGHPWGKCTCAPADTDDGFEWEGHWIVDPSVAVCERLFVDPIAYYGEAYTHWPGREAFESARVVTKSGV